MNEPLGKIAYEAFRQEQQRGWVRDGAPVQQSHEWSQLSAAEREAWQAAAQAAVSADASAP